MILRGPHPQALERVPRPCLELPPDLELTGQRQGSHSPPLNSHLHSLPVVQAGLGAPTQRGPTGPSLQIGGWW